MLYNRLVPALALFQLACGSAPAHDVKNAAWGVAFEVPDGWTAQLDGKVYQITGVDPDARMLVYRNAYSTKEALIRTYRNWKEGALLPVTDAYNDHGVSAIGYPLAGTYRETAVTGYAVDVANPAGKGLSVMVLVTNGEVQEHHAQLAAQVASTIRFMAPEVDATITASNAAWARKLGGKRLRFYLNVGASTEQTIELYADKRCTYHFYSPGAAPGDQLHNNEGEWEVITDDDGFPRLVLNFTDGTRRSFQVSETNEGFDLSGRMHLWEPLR